MLRHVQFHRICAAHPEFTPLLVPVPHQHVKPSFPTMGIFDIHTASVCKTSGILCPHWALITLTWYTKFMQNSRLLLDRPHWKIRCWKIQFKRSFYENPHYIVCSWWANCTWAGAAGNTTNLNALSLWDFHSNRIDLYLPDKYFQSWGFRQSLSRTKFFQSCEHYVNKYKRNLQMGVK